MPAGKPAGAACPQLDDHLRCKLFGRPDRPVVCRQLTPTPEMCGLHADDGRHALRYLALLEQATLPRRG